MKKKSLVTMLILAMAGSLVACAGKEEAAPVPGTKTETQADTRAGSAKAENTKVETETARDGAASGEEHLISVAMPTKDPQRWNQDGSNTRTKLEATGYEVGLQYASNDVQIQVFQMENMISNGCEILIIASIDEGSLGRPLGQAKEADIPVISYDRLLVSSDAVIYYAILDNHMVGQKQGEYLVETFGLEGNSGPFNIEIFIGDSAGNDCNFFFGGAIDVFQPCVGSGKLVVKSGQTTSEQVATANWDSEKVQNRMDTIIAGNHSSGIVLSAVLCSSDSTALDIKNALVPSYTGEYPIIAGQDCDIANVKNLIAGKQVTSVSEDTRALTSRMVKMVDAVIQGGEAGVNNTQSYGNGIGVIPTYLCGPVIVTIDNYKGMLINSGYYTGDQLK